MSGTRAEIVAGLRALADFIEARTDLPVPNHIRAQHSVIDTYVAGRWLSAPDSDEGVLRVVREAAAALPDVELRTHHDGDGNETGISFGYAVAPHAEYVVHGPFRRDRSVAP